MLVIPSVDVLGGRLARLRGGDMTAPDDPTSSPLEAARRWVAEGARWLHVVDVDGVRSGIPANLDAVAEIARFGVPVQVVGGIADVATAEPFARAGARRLVASAAASGDSLIELAQRYGDRLAAALYARDGEVVASPWAAASAEPTSTALARLREAGVRTLIFSDVTAAGGLAGPDLGLITSVARGFAGEVVYSGGIGTLDHIDALARTGLVRAVVVGRALDVGAFTLAQAQRRGLTGSG